MDDVTFRNSLMTVTNKFLYSQAKNESEKKFIRAAITTNLYEILNSNAKLQGKHQISI